MKLARIVPAAVLFLVLSAPADHAAAPLAPGDAVPSVEWSSPDGARLALASLKGDVVLVDFWASWCGPCAASFPALEELFQSYRGRGFEVVAVGLDEKRRDADRFLSDKPHAMTVVFDPEGASAKAFGVQAMPSSYLIGRDGRVRFVHTGFTPATAASYRREIEQLLQ
jgi:cytochrome c biogenesis protein CcmG, thiol:disulfide interchange protein DsbE